MIFNFPIKSEKQTIVRPIAFKIVNDLKKYLQMKIFENPSIIILDEEGVRKEVGTSTEEQGQEGIIEAGAETIQVQVEEEYGENSLLQYQDWSQEFMPIFFEPNTQTHITPYYSHVTMKFNITYRAQSKHAARAWLNSVKSKMRMFTDTFPHHLEYHYIIDERAIYILSEVYKLIKKKNPDIKPLSDWLQEHFTHRFGVIADSAGVNKEYAVTEVQTNILGHYDTDGMIEEGDKIESTPGWICTFPYLVRYMKPTSLSIYYPRVVYNQVVPDVLMGTNTQREVMPNSQATYPEDYTVYTDSAYHLAKFSSEVDMAAWELYKGVVVPHWNEFQPAQDFSIRGTDRFVDQLVLFEDEDDVGCLLLNLRDECNEFKIDPELLEFMISEKDFMLDTGQSLFQILLYQNDQMMARNALKIDKNGCIYLNQKIDLKHVYNIRIAIYYDWKYLSPDAINRLRYWLDKLKLHPMFNKYYSDLYNRVIDYLKGGRDSNNNDNWGRDYNRWNISNIKTVQIFYLINYRDRSQSEGLARYAEVSEQHI